MEEPDKENLEKIDKYYAEITFEPQIQYKKGTKSQRSEVEEKDPREAGTKQEKVAAEPVDLGNGAASQGGKEAQLRGWGRRMRPEAIKGYITKINERGKQLTIQLGPKMSSNSPVKETIFKYNVFARTKKVYNKPEAYFFELMRERSEFLREGQEQTGSRKLRGFHRDQRPTERDQREAAGSGPHKEAHSQKTPNPGESSNGVAAKPTVGETEGSVREARQVLWDVKKENVGEKLTENPILKRWKQTL